jgi:outer membrane lipoprotein-sorting protein
MSASLFLLAVGIASPLPHAAPTVDPGDAAIAAAIVARYDAIMSPAAFEATMVMVSRREDGSERSYTLKSQKLGTDKLRATFLAPANAKGQEMLRLGDTLYSYLPNLKRAVRVASPDSFMGGDFNNGDVLRVNYSADYTPSLLPGDGKTVYASLEAKSAAVSYDRIELCLSAGPIEKAQPISARYFAKSGKLLRSAVFSDVKDFGTVTRPATIVMKNEVQTSRQSTMTWSAFDLKDTISSQRFVVEDLGR